jgi:predicted NBD/HSP70 family sugar kinase
MTEQTELPTSIDNDAHCFTLAEARDGAGRGYNVVVGITLGTGVGGGIAVNGTLFHGAHGFAGEVGHMLLQPGHPPYLTDDRRGNAEQFLSGTAMGRRCTAADDPHDYLQGEVCSFMHPQIIRELAWLLTSITHCIDPSIVILGGSTGQALKPHVEEIRGELAQWLLPGMPMPEVVTAALPDAGVRGAALLACPE